MRPHNFSRPALGFNNAFQLADLSPSLCRMRYLGPSVGSWNSSPWRVIDSEMWSAFTADLTQFRWLLLSFYWMGNFLLLLTECKTWVKRRIYAYLWISMSFCLSLPLSITQSISLFTYLFVTLSVSLSLFICLSIFVWSYV